MSSFLRLGRVFLVLALIAGVGVAAAPQTSYAGTGCLPGSLKAKLNQIRQKFGPVSIVSTHRPGARIAGSGKRSYHASCQAVDFHPPKGKYRQVVAWLKKNHGGGVGTYSCGMHHVHIDNGSRVRFHKCVNGKGYASKRSKRRYASKKSKKRYAGTASKKQYAVKKSKPYGGYAAKPKAASKTRVSSNPLPFVQ